MILDFSQKYHQTEGHVLVLDILFFIEDNIPFNV